MTADARERAFQDEIIEDLLRNGWQLGSSSNYDRKRALYAEDCLAFVKQSQPKTWKKYQGLYPSDPETAFLDKLTSQLSKADPLASDKSLRTFGTLGVLRHGLRDRNTTFDLCQFKPEHELNQNLLERYESNILRAVPELVYSPYTTKEQQEETGTRSKRWRIDLVLFLNGLPIVTLELKSDFKQSVQSAIHQYCTDRLPKDPATRKPEPLLTFKRGALVHFAVSQREVYMTTKLAGKDTSFLPFNQGTSDDGAGNDIPEDLNRYATDYLWNEVLLPENLLQIVGKYLHLKIKEVETWEGRKSKREDLIFPRYHQWDLVRSLIHASVEEGPGHKYLVQHSAGSGKSFSIAWTAHQLSSLYDENGEELFHTVIVITDRTVLDGQLQDTIYQLEHQDGVVLRIRSGEGQGSKSEKLAEALEKKQPIIIVTIQTFNHVLEAIEDSASLKERRYAVIADEAHSSQSGKTANELKKVLMKKGMREDEEINAEDMLVAQVEARRASPNVSYYAFTATPKSKTMELFGRRPDPSKPSTKTTNKPEPFHVYSMRQAIEEGYILDVLKNYTNYKVAYQLAQKVASADVEVDKKKAKAKLGQWVRLHDYNIAQKVKAILEHYQDTVMGLLGGRAKAMVVTGSRKEAVRYKVTFDKQVKERGLDIRALIAFSDEVIFKEEDPGSEELVGKTFKESNMNPELKGRDMRKAFDTDDYQVMIVANKFQTGFDQPKLCAMYVDKKLGGVECVQTLSRLNRTYPGKEETYVVDFINEPDEILKAFQEYYKTATLLEVSDPNLIWDLFEKLRSSGIFLWAEVTQFAEAFFQAKKANATVGNLCDLAAQRWLHRYHEAQAAHRKHKDLFERAKKTGDPVLMANTENDMKDAKRELEALGIFKSDLGAFVRFYEFMSQICVYESRDLERLSLFARLLAPKLREDAPEDDPIDLSSVELSHYRLSKIRQQDLRLGKGASDSGLEATTGLGTARARDKKEDWLSQIISRLNEIFDDDVTEQDKLNYAYTLRDKVGENERTMQQLASNPRDQIMRGDFPRTLDSAVMQSSEAHQKMMLQYLNRQQVRADLQELVLDLLLEKKTA